MPKRQDIKSILIIGSGPIVIGQACEFDYSGTQACMALKEEGYRVVLINSNPATIMTDTNLADATYIEPITVASIEAILAIEKPDALLPTMGGQTALNVAIALFEQGILEKYGVELIGATYQSIQRAENRKEFKQLLESIGLSTPKSCVASTLSEAKEALLEIGLPVVVRPSFTLGGFGGGIAHQEDAYLRLCEQAFSVSSHQEIQIDASIYGWKEFELEVMRDKQDNCIVVCSIENFDPVGVHTGDSITVAPIQTLTDKEYQRMREAAIAIMRAVGVDTGGANVQFAVNPATGDMLVIEMNPRVSRSSALASKATGYPIARLAAKLAVGFSLSELSNEMTAGLIPASFEPALDYVVTKIPRFDLDKFPLASTQLGPQMKSVGEVMGIGKTFQESLQKAIVSLEKDLSGLSVEHTEFKSPITVEALSTPTPYRLFYIAEALRQNITVSQISECTQIDPWFLQEIAALVTLEKAISEKQPDALTRKEWQTIKQKGFTDARLSELWGMSEMMVRKLRKKLGCVPVYHRVDTCAAEFNTASNYVYSTYASSFAEHKDEPTKKILILGSGPNRIGQGIEFDYCCVHAAFAVQEAGFQAIMLNCNPETVSTDYLISNKLCFEPVSLEHVLNVIEHEKPAGVIVQLGGQTPLKLVKALHEEGVPILGSSYQAILATESRESFKALLVKLAISQPPNAVVSSIEEALQKAKALQYPLILRPSFVLGGKSMQIVYTETQLLQYFQGLGPLSFEHPVLLEHFIDDAIEIDVDAVSDGKNVVICGLLEHIEKAGVHSGDSACSYPTRSITPEVAELMQQKLTAIALEIKAVGFINAQFALKDNDIYVIEVNPRASRTIPFLSKVTDRSWVDIAVNCMIGKTLAEQGVLAPCAPRYHAVKESVFPFNKLAGSSPQLGPEMKSTGEVMGIGQSFAEAYYKAQQAAGWLFEGSSSMPSYLLITDLGKDSATFCEHLRAFQKKHPIHILLHEKYQSLLEEEAMPTCSYFSEKDRENIRALLCQKQVLLVVHLTHFSTQTDETILLEAVRLAVPYVTSMAALLAAFTAISEAPFFSNVQSLQAYL